MTEMDGQSERRNNVGLRGLGKKKSAGQLLNGIGKGLNRVGSVMKRPSTSLSNSDNYQAGASSVNINQTGLGGKSGLLGRKASVKQNIEYGTWRGKKKPQVSSLREEESESMIVSAPIRIGDRRMPDGDDTIGMPFNTKVSLFKEPKMAWANIKARSSCRFGSRRSSNRMDNSIEISRNDRKRFITYCCYT